MKDFCKQIHTFGRGVAIAIILAAGIVLFLIWSAVYLTWEWLAANKRFCAVVVTLAAALVGGSYLLTRDSPPSTHTGPALFIGDSLTTNWHVEWIVPGAVNVGIMGGRMDEISHNALEHIQSVKPGMVHIMVGSDETLLDDKVKTVRKVLALGFAARKAGATTIVIGTIPPNEVAKSFRNTLFNVSRYNTMLQVAVRVCGFRLADYNSAMADDAGAPLPGLIGDGIHPTPLGYTVMNRVLLETLGVKKPRQP